MDTWIKTVCAELNLSADVNKDVILDVARIVAHGLERPAAPITTFLLGYAVARGANVTDAAAKIEMLVNNLPAKE